AGQPVLVLSAGARAAADVPARAAAADPAGAVPVLGRVRVLRPRALGPEAVADAGGVARQPGPGGRPHRARVRIARPPAGELPAHPGPGRVLLPPAERAAGLPRGPRARPAHRHPQRPRGP